LHQGLKTYVMERLKLLVIIFALSFISCARQALTPENDGANATIIGFSSEKCACCWGYKIKLDNTPVNASALYISRGYYLTETILVGFMLPNDEKFSIRVKIEWEPILNNCPASHIKINSVVVPHK